MVEEGQLGFARIEWITQIFATRICSDFLDYSDYFGLVLLFE